MLFCNLIKDDKKSECKLSRKAYIALGILCLLIMYYTSWNVWKSLEKYERQRLQCFCDILGMVSFPKFWKRSMYFKLSSDSLVNDVLESSGGFKNTNPTKAFDDLNLHCVRLRPCRTIFIDWATETDYPVPLGLIVLWRVTEVC